MEIAISRDIRKYKTKDVGNFSFKEAGVIVLACASAFMVFKMSGKSIDEIETVIPLMLIPMALILVIGLFKPYGIPFPKYALIIIKDKLEPKIYPWETDFVYEPENYGDIYGNEYKLSKEQIQTIMLLNQPQQEEKTSKKKASKKKI